MVCKIDGCDKPKLNRGWCSPHYYRWKRTGDPLGSTPRFGMPGTENPAAKLTEDDIPVVFQLHNEGYSNKHIGAVFGVTRQNILRILRRETWTHVSVPDVL